MEPLSTLAGGHRAARPGWVWVISGFYALSVGWTLLSLALVYSGAIPLNAAQKAYLASMGIVDYVTSVAVGVLSLFGAIHLFKLRRSAVPMLGVALASNTALWLVHVLTRNVAQAIGGPGLVGALLGLLVLAAVFLYAHRLRKRGVLT